MGFESIIKKVSATIAGLVVFFLAAGVYLSAKGFVMSENGNIELVKEANATLSPAQKIVPEVDENTVFPTNRVIGNPKAPVTVYEYSSLGCYHCAEFHLNILPKIIKEYVDSGKVKISFVDFPIDKKSMQASMMARCFEGDKYFNMINFLFKKQREWSLSSKTENLLATYASLNGMNKDVAVECMNNNNIAQSIMDDRQQAISLLKVQGTPTFLVANSKGIEVLSGAQDYQYFASVIDKKLSQK